MDKSHCILLKYEWKLSNIKNDPGLLFILSNEIKYREKDSFRAGLRNPHISSTLVFLSVNLNKFGLETVGVTFTSIMDDSKEIEMDPKTIQGNEDDENMAIQMFTAPLGNFVGLSSDFVHWSFNFSIYLASKVENYRVHPMDGLVSQQLWSSAVNHHFKSCYGLYGRRNESVHQVYLHRRVGRTSHY